MAALRCFRKPTAPHSKSRPLTRTMARGSLWRRRPGYARGRESAALLRRAHEMKMEIYMKQPVKVPAYEEILRNAGVSDSAVAFIGDDLPDIPLMRRAGLAIAVGDAVPEVKKSAH